MATDKRDRQRANRAQKQAEAEAAAKRERLKRRARQVLIWAVIVAAVLILANIVWGGDAETEALAFLA
jgi:hypothetical protein